MAPKKKTSSVDLGRSKQKRSDVDDVEEPTKIRKKASEKASASGAKVSEVYFRFNFLFVSCLPICVTTPIMNDFALDTLFVYFLFVFSS